MELKALPDGAFYVMSGGRHCMDHHGNVYEYHHPIFAAPSLTLPAAEPTPPPLPDPNLSAVALRAIETEETWLAEQPIEHFTALYVDATGELVGVTRFEGKEDEVMVNVSEVLREAEAAGAAGVFAMHGHPSGSTAESDADTTLKRTLQECLHRRNIRLLASHIVPGQPRQVCEATRPRLETDWDRRCAEQARLWGPMPWRPAVW